MHLTRQETVEIAKQRAAVEVRLVALLLQAGSSVTLDEYKRAIFNGPDASQFSAYVQEALEVFDCSDIDGANEEIVSVIQDAWNYFPHRCLNGRCPAEAMAELSKE
jgi:hypothetical protein